MADDCRPKFTVLDAEAYRRTLLGGCLVNAVDCARNVATVIGARPYTVSLVTTKWTGEERGDGIEEVFSVEPILPTPMVRSVDQLTNQLKPYGIDEQGMVFVNEISVSYTEDRLAGRGEQGAPIDRNKNFYWEIGLLQQDGTTIHRRFTLQAAPGLRADNMEWQAQLVRSQPDRDRRTGEPT